MVGLEVVEEPGYHIVGTNLAVVVVVVGEQLELVVELVAIVEPGCHIVVLVVVELVGSRAAIGLFEFVGVLDCCRIVVVVLVVAPELGCCIAVAVVVEGLQLAVEFVGALDYHIVVG